MTNLNVNARAVDSDSTNSHRFPWKWYLRDARQKNGRTVFSCFSCGGGSSMGYKLAGFDVIGNVELDKRCMQVYIKNNKPKYPYLMDCRDFLKIKDSELPTELFDLDVLDGSPPCSVFSMAGQREKAWGKEKVFREGQKKQRLDDLFFTYIRIAKKLKPKVAIAENVAGLLRGNAKGYVNEIFHAFSDAGYDVQLFLLNAAFMGVPQERERCFFIARRKDLHFQKLNLSFNEPLIMFGDVRTAHGKPFAKNGKYKELLKYRRPGDRSIADITKRESGKESGFNNRIWHDDEPGQTIVSSGCHFRMCDGLWLSDGDLINVQTFPQDYDFCGQSVQYVCGMSVPPVMMANIAHEIDRQWLQEENHV